MADLVSLTFEYPVATLTIQREAALNALNRELLTAVESVLDGLQSEFSENTERFFSRCRVLLITGAGSKSFVAGADIKLFAAASDNEVGEFIALGQRVMRKIEQLPLPVIAQVNGFAFGGGFELALACDSILAADTAKFGLPEVTLGLIPGFGGTQRLVDRVGLGTARRLIFTGESLSAEEAFRLGIVQWLCPASQLQQRAAEISAVIASRAPLAIGGAKRAIGEGRSAGLETGLAAEVAEFKRVHRSADGREGVKAFAEKRPAVFRGK